MFARARAELLSDALRANVRALSRHAGVPVLLPVKANAYGHGTANVVRATHDLAEVWGYGVATPCEASQIVGLGADKPVLLLTPSAPEERASLAALGVRLCVASGEEARELPRGARFHLKVNTGMNRLGVRPEDAAHLAADLAARGALEGLYTHFASADVEGAESAEAQLARFARVVEDVRRFAPDVLAHASNSGGVLRFGPRAAFDLVRPGIAAYGFAPDGFLEGVVPLSPALRVTARVTHVHTVLAGESVSYAELWRAPRDTEVAVVAAGYADGWPRRATGQARVRLGGEVRPVLGRICMDQCMVDVSGLDVRRGDWAELYGPGEVSAADVADWAGTNVYEVLTSLGARVERVVAPPA